jgi:hypothetical protein
LGLGQATEELLLADLFDPLKGEGRTRTVAQQHLQSGPVVAGAESTEASSEKPTIGERVTGVVAIQEAAAGEPMRHAVAYQIGDRSDLVWRQCRSVRELDSTGCEWLQHPWMMQQWK